MSRAQLLDLHQNSHYATRTLLIAIFRIDVAWIWTTHEIPLVSLHLRIGINGFLFSNGFIGVIAYSYLPDLLIAILDAHRFLNHQLAFTRSATHQRPISGKRSV